MWVRCACALALLGATLASLHGVGAGAGKRAEMAPAPFVLGSRYGRSPPRQIAPRNDRFFMGSRYGKRSEPALHQARFAADRQGALTALDDRQAAFSALGDRQGALAALSGRPPPPPPLHPHPHHRSPSLLWQAAALLAGRSHRTFDVDP